MKDKLLAKLIEEKEALEMRLLSLISEETRKFYKDTGLSARMIRVNIANFSELGGSPHYEVTDVTVDLGL